MRLLRTLPLLALMVACGQADSPVSDFASGDPTDNDSGSSAPGDGSPSDENASSGDGDGSAGPPSGDAAEPTSSHEDGTPDDEVIANPFVDAAQDPFSTFAADVDTASYDVFRQYVSQYGQLPSAELVRIEDFVNFFDYDYPTPAFDAEAPFAIQLEAAAHPMARQSSLLRVGIQAKAAPVEAKKPANLVFLVDTSGSMQSPEKLPLAQYLFEKSLDVLDPNDTVSIVSYAGDVAVRLGPTKISERETIVSAIDGLESGGGTAGASGIRLAYDQARIGFVEEGINHVVLCTDGDFNIGVSSTKELVDLIKEQRSTGVTLTALGFGQDNLNDAMMEAVSNAGNGMYSVIYAQEQADKYAAERLLSTIVHVAKDMKIQVEFNPALVKAYRLIGYENRAVADDDFRDDLVDGGEVGAEHRVTALYEVVLADQSLPPGVGTLDPGESSELVPEIGAGELVRVKVRFKQPGDSDADAASEVAQALAPEAVSSEAPALTSDLAWASSVAAFAERLRASPFAAASELDRIAAVLEAQKALDAERAEFAGLFVEARALLGSSSR